MMLHNGDTRFVAYPAFLNPTECALRNPIYAILTFFSGILKTWFLLQETTPFIRISLYVVSHNTSAYQQWSSRPA